jgi:hypothetical protein
MPGQGPPGKPLDRLRRRVSSRESDDIDALYGLEPVYEPGAGGPSVEAESIVSIACPWCGDGRKVLREETSFPASCPRCNRGTKLDWAYCPWCYGPGFDDLASRTYTDRRYVAHCRNPKCDRADLMPFMRYCPWCRTKVRQKWKITGSADTCGNCGWGVLREFWMHCPWCTANLT